MRHKKGKGQGLSFFYGGWRGGGVGWGPHGCGRARGLGSLPGVIPGPGQCAGPACPANGNRGTRILFRRYIGRMTRWAKFLEGETGRGVRRVLCGAFAALASLLATTPAGARTPVAPDPAMPHQAFEGWGVSLGWWANGVGRWNEPERARIAGWIADPDTGLGYTLFRYNIGGGEAPGHDHMRRYGDVPGYKPTETGPYDWSADASQRRVVADLAAGRTGLVWEAFANSPPWWMTKSGCAAGNVDGSDNLKPEYFDDFADYLADVVKKFHDDWGVTFRTVTPFNEPSARW